MESLGGNMKTEIDIEFIRHMILNSLRSLRLKFHDEEMIIACDSRHYWRKDFFPFYKANRKKDREKSPLDWNKIHECFKEFKDELRKYFPYRILEVEGAEADDIIGVLAIEYGSELNIGEQIIIASEDKDFAQLHRFGNVRQYGPVFKKDWIVVEDPELFLKEQIIKGDRGDGIPNILSPANTLVIGVRQKSVMSAKLKDWVTKEAIDFCDPTMLQRYLTNQKLIDLTFIPEDIKVKILDAYNEQENKKSGNLFEYFRQTGLKSHLMNIQDFR